jgi:uncharacterized protein
VVTELPQPEKPDIKVLHVWRISNLLTYGVILGIVFLVTGVLVLFGQSSARILLWNLVPVVLWLVGEVSLRRQWENWTYRLTPETLEMSHGWVWKQRRIVARDRIQHVDINSGPLDRRFGLVQVVVHTAGTSVGFIPGLCPERADMLRDELMVNRELV